MGVHSICKWCRKGVGNFVHVYVLWGKTKVCTALQNRILTPTPEKMIMNAPIKARNLLFQWSRECFGALNTYAPSKYSKPLATCRDPSGDRHSHNERPLGNSYRDRLPNVSCWRLWLGLVGDACTSERRYSTPCSRDIMWTYVYLKLGIISTV